MLRKRSARLRKYTISTDTFITTRNNVIKFLKEKAGIPEEDIQKSPDAEEWIKDLTVHFSVH